MPSSPTETSPVEAPSSPQVKLLTVLLGSEGDLRVQALGEHFQGLSQEETRSIMADLLLEGAQLAHQEAFLLDESSTPELQETPMNPGSLYDDLVFESALYARGEELLMNTSFGSLAKGELPVSENLTMVAAAFAHLYEELQEKPSE